MDTPAQLVDDYARANREARPIDRMLDLVHADPRNAYEILRLLLPRFKQPTHLDGVVSFVPEELLGDLATQAVHTLMAERDHDLAEHMIASLAFQGVSSLQPFLSDFYFDRVPSTCCGLWPWRGASEEDVERLLPILRTRTSANDRVRPLMCVLQPRREKHVAAVLAALGAEELPNERKYYLHEVGFDSAERRLYSETTFHIRFPDVILSALVRPWRNLIDPTWRLPSSPQQHRFGGICDSACGICNGPLHNLITLDPVPRGLAFFGVPTRLQIATCMSCLGWSKAPMFFKHDETGSPAPMDCEYQTPEFPMSPLQEYQVELCESPPRWQWQDCGASNGRQNLHRIGGHPVWVQYAQYPECPGCKRTMPFLMQLDSYLPTVLGECLWGSGGICYVFWCGECRISSSIWQCT